MLSLFFPGRDTVNCDGLFLIIMKYILPLIIVALVGWQCSPSHGANAQSSPKKKSESVGTKKSVSVLEQVNSETLKDVLDDNDEVLVLFYEDNKSPNARKLVTSLEKIDLSDLPDVTFVRISDLAEAEEFGLGLNELPRIIFFQNSIPKEYSGDVLDLKALKTWVKEELESIDVDELDLNTMEKVVEGGSPFVIMFVDDPKRELKSEAAILKVCIRLLIIKSLSKMKLTINLRRAFGPKGKGLVEGLHRGAIC